MNRFKVIEGKEEAFERRWSERESKLEGMDGFLTFLLLRRDALKAEDGYNYSTLTVWKNRESFDAWRASSANASAHSKAGRRSPCLRVRRRRCCTRVCSRCCRRRARKRKNARPRKGDGGRRVVLS